MAVRPKRAIKVFRGQKPSGWESSASPPKKAAATVVRLPAPSRTRMARCGTLRRAQAHTPRWPATPTPGTPLRPAAPATPETKPPTEEGLGVEIGRAHV